MKVFSPAGPSLARAPLDGSEPLLRRAAPTFRYASACADAERARDGERVSEQLCSCVALNVQLQLHESWQRASSARSGRDRAHPMCDAIATHGHST